MTKTQQIMTMLTAVFTAVTLSGCADTVPLNDVTESPSETVSEAVGEPVQDTTPANIRADEFLENFVQDYPDFELVDYVIGSEENSPIQLAVVARNKQGGSSSTLFIVDPNGVGQVVLASDSAAFYREEDGIALEGNRILLSLSVRISAIDYEIHDYELTVTQEEDQGVTGMLYSSNENIRAS